MECVHAQIWGRDVPFDPSEPVPFGAKILSRSIIRFSSFFLSCSNLLDKASSVIYSFLLKSGRYENRDTLFFEGEAGSS